MKRNSFQCSDVQASDTECSAAQSHRSDSQGALIHALIHCQSIPIRVVLRKIGLTAGISHIKMKTTRTTDSRFLLCGMVYLTV